ncbi:hypothetical protein GQ42DRAFT_21119 [Ramicandelaber brevisporus]|nr:hypothetical protein GQ42DRAFT_21119 [Ramicandelaber brevisporus]
MQQPDVVAFLRRLQEAHDEATNECRRRHQHHTGSLSSAHSSELAIIQRDYEVQRRDLQRMMFNDLRDELIMLEDEYRNAQYEQQQLIQEQQSVTDGQYERRHSIRLETPEIDHDLRIMTQRL